ncbi:maternal protein exuperantia [Diabrotica virgifera virgifera]|uniref:Maternal protein exuperantia n=1 Tax=Diabrotica virgifera virgifera TaxID=50390 RepID=A0ABM5KW35_DIAVI|nr:maternal protein exuperantia [Diabrotica virgifera virgifera]XP_050514407.1 maternal protein exuperantia [Diabrotica virgifera virgifera]XP_050514408.1 maternal protein exuperantia [Diabrotica virgifera virgifera]
MMVQKESANSGDERESSVPVVPENPAKGIPTGKYKLVGWGIDTTGRRLIDEIIQIAAFTPESQFSQYVMPFGDLNPTYSRRHGIRVVNTIRYRRLKDVNTQEFLKTKSEISALQDFLKWLETVKGNDVDGIILIYYELRKASPGMLLESLRRHNMIERFQKVVKGFANGFNIAQAKCGNTTKSFNLHIMSKVLLNRGAEHFNSAVDRARASFDIAAHLAQGEREELKGEAASKDCTGTESHLMEVVCPYVNPIDAEEEEIALFKVLLERQNTFRPVFGALLRASRTERQHASHLRRLLAENNINYDKLKIAYDSDAKDGLEKVIKSEVANAKDKDLEELLDILDRFFDPEKKAIQPKPKPSPQRYPYGRRPKFVRNKNNSQSKNPKTNSTANDNPTASDDSSPRSESEQPAQDGPEVTSPKEEKPVEAQ